MPGSHLPLATKYANRGALKEFQDSTLVAMQHECAHWSLETECFRLTLHTPATAVIWQALISKDMEIVAASASRISDELRFRQIHSHSQLTAAWVETRRYQPIVVSGVASSDGIRLTSYEGTDMIIPSPKFAAGHRDRARECQFVLAATFVDFVGQVQSAGWTEDEAAEAMLSLARNHLLRIITNRKARARIDEMHGRNDKSRRYDEGNGG